MPNQQQSIPDQFSDEEMSQIQRHGAAQMGDPGFSDEVEKHLKYREELNAKKMHAALTGGGDTDLGPSKMEQAQGKQTQALQQAATTQGAQQAVQAQAAQQPLVPPSAPGTPVGASKPFPAQAGPQPQAPVEPPQEEEQQGPPPGPPAAPSA
jgi:hypothetical protein